MEYIVHPVVFPTTGSAEVVRELPAQVDAFAVYEVNDLGQEFWVADYDVLREALEGIKVLYARQALQDEYVREEDTLRTDLLHDGLRSADRLLAYDIRRSIRIRNAVRKARIG
jgi:hypothetical protein